MLVPFRLFAATLVFFACNAAFGDGINGAQVLVCATAAWWVSPFRIWTLVARAHRRTRIRAQQWEDQQRHHLAQAAQAAWQQQQHQWGVWQQQDPVVIRTDPTQPREPWRQPVA
jgi:hypothetical protein